MAVSFTKKTWANGQSGGTPVTAAELNRIEQGIADAVSQSNSNAAGLSGVKGQLSPSGLKLYAGALGRKEVDSYGHVQLWTQAEFQEAFGASPQDCLIAVNSRNSGGSGFWLATPRFNGSAVWTTCVTRSEDGSVVTVQPSDTGQGQTVPVAYLVAVY